jgi:chromosome segregation ATPase
MVLNLEIEAYQVKRYKKGKYEQWTIPLKAVNTFEDNETVYIISKTDFDNYKSDNQKMEIDYKNRISELKSKLQRLEDNNSLKDYEGLESKYNQLKEYNQKMEIDYKNRISQLEALKNDYRLTDYDNLKNKYDLRESQETKLRNKLDHLQERLRVALEEINQQQKVISDLSNRSFFNYLTGKLPESYKELSEGKKE